MILNCAWLVLFSSEPATGFMLPLFYFTHSQHMIWVKCLFYFALLVVISSNSLSIIFTQNTNKERLGI